MTSIVGFYSRDVLDSEDEVSSHSHSLFESKSLNKANTKFIEVKVKHFSAVAASRFNLRIKFTHSIFEKKSVRTFSINKIRFSGGWAKMTRNRLAVLRWICW